MVVDDSKMIIEIFEFTVSWILKKIKVKNDSRFAKKIKDVTERVKKKVVDFIDYDHDTSSNYVNI